MSFAQDNEILFFGGGDLSEHLRQIEFSSSKYIEGLPENQISQSDEEDLVAHCNSKFSVDPIRIYKDRVVSDYQESQVDVRGDRMRFFPGERSEPFYVSSLKITYRIPYTGDYVLWKKRPSTWRSTAPRATVIPSRGEHPGEVVITINRPSDVGAEEFRKLYNQTVDDIEFYVGSQGGEISQFNAALSNKIRGFIKARKEKLNAHKDILEQLNIPIRPREDAPPLEPIPMKKIIVPLPSLSKTNPRPEFSITEDIYSHILKVIRHEGRTWEASPHTYAVHDEEELRDIILSHLNTHFEGKASSETFRRRGKTDIRIEAEDRAAFVAECKVWTGAKGVPDALDQMLSYLTWRDCRSALVFFNKKVAGFSDILSRLPTAIEGHPNFKRKLFEEADKGEWRYLFGSAEDSQREVMVHVFMFNLYVNGQ